jgi:hypothetical protein
MARREKTSSGKWLDVDQYMNHQEPNLDRDTFTATNQYTMQLGGDFKIPRDFDKCEFCGGRGMVWEESGKHKRRRVSTLVPCSCVTEE